MGLKAAHIRGKEREMHWTTKTLIILVVMLAGCSSAQQKPPTTAKEATKPVDTSGMDKMKMTETAKGELRELLLALRRVHFSYDSTDLGKEACSALAEAATKLNNNPGVQLYVDGHADDRGTEEYNVALGERRAKRVADYLIEMGVSPERLSVMSFGEEHPLLAEESPSAWSLNRRVEFRLMRGQVKLVIEEGTQLDDQGRPMISSAKTTRIE